MYVSTGLCTVSTGLRQSFAAHAHAKLMLPRTLVSQPTALHAGLPSLLSAVVKALASCIYSVRAGCSQKVYQAVIDCQCSSMTCSRN